MGFTFKDGSTPECCTYGSYNPALTQGVHDACTYEISGDRFNFNADNDVPVLVHYDMSPFAEKARRMLAFKGIAYKSHVVKAYEPRPSLQALTGGYRRIPVLSHGRDVYCDTRLIAQFLDAFCANNEIDKPICSPEPLTQLSFGEYDVFQTIIGFRMKDMFSVLEPEEMKALAADRALFSKNSKTKFVDTSATDSQRKETICGYLREMESALVMNEHGTLSGHRNFKAIDFEIYHSFWFPFKTNVKDFGNFPLVDKWMARMRDLGDGKFESFSDRDVTHAVQTSITSNQFLGKPTLPPTGYAIGNPVSVQPDDYGIFPTTGTLVAVTNIEFVVERSDDTCGTVYVHFPRTGFELAPPAKSKY